VGRVNDLAYGYDLPTLAPAIVSLPDSVLLAYGGNDTVAGALGFELTLRDAPARPQSWR
jgi:hypothetical protein